MKPRKLGTDPQLDDQQRWKNLCDALAEDAENGKTRLPTKEELALAKRVKASLRQLGEGHAAKVEGERAEKKERSGP